MKGFLKQVVQMELAIYFWDILKKKLSTIHNANRLNELHSTIPKGYLNIIQNLFDMLKLGICITYCGYTGIAVLRYQTFKFIINFKLFIKFNYTMC